MADKQFPTVGDGSGIARQDLYHKEELALALRNHGIPLEGLRYPVTPTGMHYLLVHFDVPATDVTTHQVHIGGLVQRPWTLTLDDIRARPSVTLPVTMECAGNGRAWMTPRPISQPWLGEAVGTAEWTGTPLCPLLEEVGLEDTAAEIVFTGADRGFQGGVDQLYQRALTIEEATRDEVILAYEMNGQPLEPQHGAPLRLLVPGWYGMTSVKWLTTIEAIDHAFDGFQQQCAYRYTDSADDLGEPVTTILPRALISPPGVPDFLTRVRVVAAGEVTLTGRAWSGRDQIIGVEVSTDGGDSWSEAELDEPVGAFAWRGWSFRWNARPGPCQLAARARSESGETQPGDAWNHQGVGNNTYHRVDVIVE
jgi:DMSO/TMAO reductase YedYZ molybdopterin-dependent catalytic subunit